MIVVTADRPAELRGVGAPQTIDQIDLYGRHVRWSRDAGVADDGERTLWRSQARDAWSHAVVGPVQLNLPFREPLIGLPGELPPVEAPAIPESVQPVRSRSVGSRSGALPCSGAERGVILVGGRSGVPPSAVAALHAQTGWPVVADPISAMRNLPGVLAAADSILRSESFVARHVPEVIVRIGRPASSKVLAQWSASVGCPVVQVGGPGVIDPERNVAVVCTIDEVLATAPSARAPGWLDGWLAAESIARAAIEDWLAASDELTEPGVARTVATCLPGDADLTVASSMPVRDLEWFGGPAARAHANRGANGIDGVVSTALGRALAGRTSVVLIGDLAFVHDSNALVGLSSRGADLRIVVVDNDGGGIFSFLPQATSLESDRFEQLFGTPLGADVLALAGAHGIPTSTVTSVEALAAQLASTGPWVCRVPSDRSRNVRVHQALHAAVVSAIDAHTVRGG
jgi:2-succinyl-5-enolpyruvyl-6-hydroxy-3-cyclohexene-1-carboxylate synthase